MECLDTKQRIENFARAINKVSYEEKRRPEAVVDDFLDSILHLKSQLNKLTSILEDLTVEFEKLTWAQGMDEECLIALNDLIASARDFYSVEIRFYVNLKTIRKSGIAKDEVRNFKMALDDYKESYEDLEEIFVLQSHKKEIEAITNRFHSFK